MTSTTSLKKPSSNKAKPAVPASVPPAPPPVEREVLTFGGMQFALDFNTALPDMPLTGARSPELPFRGWYDKAAATLTPERSQMHIFLPRAFWTGVRKVAEDKLTSGYVRSKLRNVFNAWNTDKNLAYELLIYDRPDGLPGDTANQGPGHSVWVRLKQQAV